jgi:hypothetical protein
MHTLAICLAFLAAACFATAVTALVFDRRNRRRT